MKGVWRVKISLVATTAALVVLAASMVPLASTASARGSECGPQETTAVVFPYSGDEMRTGYIACANKTNIKLHTVVRCTAPPGTPHKRLRSYGEGAEPECVFPDGSSPQRG